VRGCTSIYSALDGLDQFILDQWLRILDVGNKLGVKVMHVIMSLAISHISNELTIEFQLKKT
jgi:hypothetical protein